MLLAERYRLDTRLGRGGMGEVWRGWDERLARPVAVKLLPERSTDDPAVMARFEREARTAAGLNHEHLVAVYDFGVSGERCFLVMELVEGCNLADELRREGPSPVAKIAEIATQAAAGLAAAHAHGIVHRDVKPANLLLAECGTVKVADFGIARGVTGTAASDLTQTGAIMGTSLYMAPETALGQDTETASDVYSLGCTLYELLTGTPPFVAESPLAVLRQHVEELPAAPHLAHAEVPGALSAYLLTMLDKDPRSRPTAQQASDWFADADWSPPDGIRLPFAGETPLVAITAELPPPAARMGSHGGILAGAAAVTVLVAAGLAIALGPATADGESPPRGPAAVTQPAGNHGVSPQPKGSGQATGPAPQPPASSRAAQAQNRHSAVPSGQAPTSASAGGVPSSPSSTAPTTSKVPTTAPTPTTPSATSTPSDDPTSLEPTPSATRGKDKPKK